MTLQTPGARVLQASVSGAGADATTLAGSERLNPLVLTGLQPSCTVHQTASMQHGPTRPQPARTRTRRRRRLQGGALALAEPPAHLSCLSASPWPWKNRKDRKKSAMKIMTSEMTTADVVDSPTPLAPPVVVKPQEQLTCAAAPR